MLENNMFKKAVLAETTLRFVKWERAQFQPLSDETLYSERSVRISLRYKVH